MKSVYQMLDLCIKIKNQVVLVVEDISQCDPDKDDSPNEQTFPKFDEKTDENPKWRNSTSMWKYYSQNAQPQTRRTC